MNGTETIQQAIRRLSITSAGTQAGTPSQVTIGAGDPNCTVCGGSGLLRLDIDLPVDHPDFGRLYLCNCRERQIAETLMTGVYALNDIQTLKALTFENFNPEGNQNSKHPPTEKEKKTLKEALAKAREYAARPEGWLFIVGPHGCGKTHLAAAIANQVVAHGKATIFVTVPDLLDKLRAGITSKEAPIDERMDRIKEIPLLVIDDLGAEQLTDWTRSKLFQLINHRYIRELPTVTTTNLTFTQLHDRYPRSASRLTDKHLSTTALILAPDYRNGK